jgi:hypothetical protein
MSRDISGQEATSIMLTNEAPEGYPTDAPILSFAGQGPGPEEDIEGELDDDDLDEDELDDDLDDDLDDEEVEDWGEEEEEDEE